jgi:hypothetical protein
VETTNAKPDQGIQVPYHPQVKDVSDFTFHADVYQDGIIDLQYPDLCFNNWHSPNDMQKGSLLTVSGTHYSITRWDLTTFAGKQVAGSGLLELTTFSLQRSPDFNKDFGMIRVVEIIGGDPNWNQDNVTWQTFCQKQDINQVLNGQMIIDVEVAKEVGSKNYITIPQPVLQRLIDGKTKGIAIKPLGAVHASFYSMENIKDKFGARLHFNLTEAQ